MRKLLSLLLVLVFSVQATAAATWSQDIQKYVSTAKTLDDLDLGTEQGQLIQQIDSLNDEDFENAILQLGQAWATHAEEVEPVIRKLQSMWERKNVDPIRATSNLTEAQLIEQGKWLGLFSLFLSMTKPKMLPLLITTFVALQLSSDQGPAPVKRRRAPLEILVGLSAPKKMVEEEAARAFDNAKADLAAGLAGTIATQVIVGSEAAGSIGLTASRFAKQAFLFSLVAYSVSGAARSYLSNRREGELVSEVATLKSQLEKSLKNNAPNLGKTVHSYVESVQHLAAFYAFETAKLTENGNRPSSLILGRLQNQCQDQLDQRLMLEALLEKDTATARELVETMSPSFKWQFDYWNATLSFERTKTVGFKNKAEMARFEDAFLSAPDENRPYLERLQKDLMSRWGDCGDGVYLLFNTVQYLSELERLYPQPFQAIEGLKDARERISGQYKFALMERRGMIKLIPRKKF